MEHLTAKVLDLPTTIQEYRFDCPAFRIRHGYIINDNNYKVTTYRLSKMTDTDLRSQAKALLDVVAQSGAIIWTLLDMPLQEYGMTVEKAIQLIQTTEYRRCASMSWAKWWSYADPRLDVDIRTRIQDLQVVPDGLEIEHLTQETADNWCKTFDLPGWELWNPCEAKDSRGFTYIK